MGVGHGYSVGTGGHDFFMSVLFRAVFDCLFVDELAAYVSCDFVDSGKFGLDVFACMDSWVWLVAGWGGMVGARPALGCRCF